jgi:hypothetical protein
LNQIDRMKKDNYKRDFLELTTIINKWDPIGLISSGAPEDEYSCATNEILSILYKGGRSGEIKNYIFNDMNEHFGFDNEIKEYVERYNKKIDNVCQEITIWFINKK